jgi:hypothetical protein
VAKQRIQTQYAANQVRLTPQASPVNTYVQPSRDSQISKALDSVTGAVQRVEVKAERKMDMIQASKKQSAQNSFGIGFRALMEQEQFAEMTNENLIETPQYQKLFNSSLDQVDDEELKGMLANSITESTRATSNASSALYARKRLQDAGSVWGSSTLDMHIYQASSTYSLVEGRGFGPDGLTQEQLNQETADGFASYAADIETILKDKYGYSNTDLQNFWLKEQERRGEEFMDTFIGDYLIEAGNGGPDYRNKVLGLIEKAKTNASIANSASVTDYIIDINSTAAAGGLTTADELELKSREKKGDISSFQRISITNANTTAIAVKAAGVRRNGALASAVGKTIQGEFDLTGGTYVDQNNKIQTISKDDIDKATQLRITEIVNTNLPDGTPEQKLAAEIGLYSNINVVNESWQHQVDTAFSSLGTGDFVPESPQFQTTMQKFQLMKQLHAGNPQMFKKYLKNTAQRAMFTEWRVMSAYGDSEQDALRGIGSADHLQGQAGSKDLVAFADKVVANLDTWTNWDDVAGDNEDVKTLFKERMVEYAKVIAKYTDMNPEKVVKAYMEEVKQDHSVVNGKLVFMGNMDIDNKKFQEDAQAYIAASMESFGVGAFEPEQITLRHTGRGKTFWVVDQAGRVLPVAPLHLNTFYGLADRQEREAKQLEANNRQASR